MREGADTIPQIGRLAAIAGYSIRCSVGPSGTHDARTHDGVDLIIHCCMRRQFLLRPDAVTNNAFLYCLIEALLRNRAWVRQ